MKFDVGDKNRCRLVCVKFHLNRCRFAAAVAKCLGGSLFGTQCIVSSGDQTNDIHLGRLAVSTYERFHCGGLSYSCVQPTLLDSGLCIALTLGLCGIHLKTASPCVHRIC